MARSSPLSLSATKLFDLRPTRPTVTPAPQLAIHCGSAADVARGIRYACDNGISIVPRGGGHCFAGRSSTVGILLDLTALNRIHMADDGCAIIGGGACLAQAYSSLNICGRTPTGRLRRGVGIAGLALGGGIRLLGCQYDLTCDRLVGAEVVLADSRIVSCDAERKPELFWALRGAAGGQVGVVTSLIFDTIPQP